MLISLLNQDGFSNGKNGLDSINMVHLGALWNFHLFISLFFGHLKNLAYKNISSWVYLIYKNMLKTKLTFKKMTNFLVKKIFLKFWKLKVHQNAPYFGVQYSLYNLKNSKNPRKILNF